MIMAFWIGIAARDHVMKGVAGGFAQLGHGREAAVRRLHKDDWLVYYAPRTALKGGKVVQGFVALGQVRSAEPYQVQVSKDFSPFRIDVEYYPCRDAPIRPLLAQLKLTRERGNKWGMALRRSLVRSDVDDFRLIAHAMDASPGF